MYEKEISQNSVLDFKKGLCQEATHSQSALTNLVAAVIFWQTCHGCDSREARQGQTPSGPGTMHTVSSALFTQPKGKEGLSSATLC